MPQSLIPQMHCLCTPIYPCHSLIQWKFYLPHFPLTIYNKRSFAFFCKSYLMNQVTVVRRSRFQFNNKLNSQSLGVQCGSGGDGGAWLFRTKFSRFCQNGQMLLHLAEYCCIWPLPRPLGPAPGSTRQLPRQCRDLISSARHCRIAGRCDHVKYERNTLDR